MKVMEAAVRILESEGVNTIFGIPGAGILPFYAALKNSTKIKHYLARHEEGASHAADGYARVTGKVGVCSCTSGPGGTNFVTGLYAAMVDSIPMVAITGQAVRSQLGRDAFQAVDIAEIVKPVVKKSFCVKEAAQVPWVFREAFRIAREGRPGPVLIDLPVDVQAGEVEYESFMDAPLAISKPEPNGAKIRRALQMLLEAKNPVLLMGGGVITANTTREFVELAEYLSVPVVTTLMAKGGMRPDHPLYAGQVGIQCGTIAGNKIFLEADVVLGIGCRFTDRHTGAIDIYTKGKKFIHIDVEPTQIGRIIPTQLGIVSDAKLALEALIGEAKQISHREPGEREKGLPELRQQLERRLDFDNVPIKPQRVFKEINEFFDEDTMFTTCIGLNQIWSSQFQTIFKPRHYIMPGGAGPLGWDLPAAIGVKVANPDKIVVDVVGDYGFGFCGEELAMAVMYNLPVIVIIINNGYLSLIRQAEKYNFNMDFEVQTWYEKEHLIDFVKYAQAYGAHGERVDKPGNIKAAFQRAINSGKPAIIDIIVERETDASMGPSIDKVKEFEPIPERVVKR